METEQWVRTTVKLKKDIHGLLKKEAADQGRSLEDLIRAAVERELSGQPANRFADVPSGGERLLLREIEKQLHQTLDRIRRTLVGHEAGSREFLLTVADTFVECIPVPILIRETSASWRWSNSAYDAAFKQSPEDENLMEIDGRSEVFRVVNLQVDGVPTLFHSWQFSFFDSSDKKYIGDVLFPHVAVDMALRGQQVLMPISPWQDDAVRRTSVDNPLLECFVAFLEGIPLAATIKDLNGRYQWANTHLLKLLGKTLDEVIGKKPADLFPAQGLTMVNELEDLVKFKKMGLLASTPILLQGNSQFSRTALRFPLIDAQSRMTQVGSLGIGPDLSFDGFEPETDEVSV